MSRNTISKEFLQRERIKLGGEFFFFFMQSEIHYKQAWVILQSVPPLQRIELI